MKQLYFKGVSATLALALLLGTAPASLAATSSDSTSNSGHTTEKAGDTETEPVEGALTKDEALAKVQEVLNLPEGYELQSVRYYKSKHNPYGTWNFDYVKKENDEVIGRIDVSIDAEHGGLTRYSQYSNKDKGSYPPKVNRDEAEKIALDFLQDIAPKKRAQVMLNPFNHQDERPIINAEDDYRFQFVRQHNGIPYPQNYISVTVTTNGNIQNFYLNWDQEVQFENGDSLTSADNAINLFKQAWKDDLQPVYVKPFNDPEGKFYIAYQWFRDHQNSVQYIDAQTGKTLNHKLEQTNASSMEEIPVTNVKIQPHYNYVDQELGEEEALAHAKKILTVDFSGFKLQSSSYSSYEGQPTWRFHYEPAKREDGRHQWLSFSVSTKTGAILNYRFDDGNFRTMDSEENKESTIPTLPEEQIYQSVRQSVIQFVPEYANQLYLDKSSYQELEYSDVLATVLLRHKTNGIYSSRSTIRVTVNKHTGEITRFYFNNRNMTEEYPQPNNLITTNDAITKIFNDSEVVLTYQTYVTPEDPEKNIIPEAQLVYKMMLPREEDPLFFNAQTGEWQSTRSGEVVNLYRKRPTDINGHWAEQALMLMFDYKALDTDENGHIQPNAKMKRGEMIKMIILAMNRGRFYPMYSASRDQSFNDVGLKSPYFQYVERAVDLNLIDKNSENFNPEEILTREETAELIVNALGYGKLAEQNGLFKLDIQDLDQVELVGHVAIVTNLGIMNPQNGKFHPDQEITRAQAAVAFKRYLEKRTELTQEKRY